MAAIPFEELARIRERHAGQTIVFCSGSFDLTHAGHILFFEDCKQQGDVVVVGIGSDVDLRKNKGDKRPILNEHVRLKSVSSITSVDYAFIIPTSPTDDLQAFLHDVFSILKPDIYVINEDAFDIPRRKEMLGNHATTLVILKRWCPPEFEQISTTKIITKVKSL